MKEVFDYRILSPGDLANSVMTEWGWLDFLRIREEALPALDLALIFVGKQLQSLDIFGSKNSDPTLVDLLKTYFSNASFSVAFPYVSPTEKKVAMESSLISEFADACHHNLRVSNITFLEPCSVKGENFDKIAEVFQRRRLFCLAFGIVLLLLAPIVSSWVPFYYSNSMAIGVCLVIIISLFQGMKLLPTGRKNAFYLMIYGSVLVAGSFLVNQFLEFFNSILVNFGISQEMHIPMAVFLLAGIVLAGVCLGFPIFLLLINVDEVCL
ncbi:unnamed protein product [Fraxinus pennsylvanica]|uniref:Uncharacterized protein n=1 Tax=Fraxinus pennsylvanica TaxID=56036 RepID=A0AAD1YY60_9LAMI|nr:unnamed protein product [Fraxinus pennsylvanica]